jgi:hypothetical protein
MLSFNKYIPCSFTAKSKKNNNSVIVRINVFHMKLEWLNRLEELFAKNKKNKVIFNLASLLHTTSIDDNTNSSSESQLIQNILSSTNINDAFKALANIWKQSKFCDLIIVVRHREYLAHRVAIAFYSEKYKYSHLFI